MTRKLERIEVEFTHDDVMRLRCLDCDGKIASYDISEHPTLAQLVVDAVHECRPKPKKPR